ncbi:MAG: hypothetical protein KF893_15645 [Caldilineaceae bacterium]|nr:hypothetical protein [Caldilineaceae bacterium]
MNRLSMQLGFWSATLGALMFVVYTVAFVAILLVSPLFLWTNFADYVEYTRRYHTLWPELGRLSMLIFSLLFVVLLASLEEYARAEEKILVRISRSFALGLAVLAGSFYFVQISAVRINFQNGEMVGLEQVIQGNPYSAFAALNMMGWTVFFALSSLFVAPIFHGGRLERVIRWAFLINGISCLLGAVGYIFENIALIFVTINLIMGGAILVVTVGLAIFFRRKRASGAGMQVAGGKWQA